MNAKNVCLTQLLGVVADTQCKWVHYFHILHVGACVRFRSVLTNPNYRPQRSWGQGNIFTPVRHSVHGGGGVCLRQTPPGADTHPPPGQTPLGQTPPGSGLSTPPPGSRLRHTVNERPVRILLECILVFGLFLQAPAVGKLLMELMTEGKFKTIDVQRFMFDRLLSNKRILEQNIVWF